MKLKCWKRIVNQKGNIWYQVGKNKENPLHLTEKWVNISEHTPHIKKEFGVNWEVRAPKSNKKTIDGTSTSFKTRQGAMNFANKYMKKHDKC